MECLQTTEIDSPTKKTKGVDIMTLLSGVIIYLITVALIIAFGRFLHECDYDLSSGLRDGANNRNHARR